MSLYSLLSVKLRPYSISILNSLFFCFYMCIGLIQVQVDVSRRDVRVIHMSQGSNGVCILKEKTEERREKITVKSQMSMRLYASYMVIDIN